jgi:hypothetical protein
MWKCGHEPPAKEMLTRNDEDRSIHELRAAPTLELLIQLIDDFGTATLCSHCFRKGSPLVIGELFSHPLSGGLVRVLKGWGRSPLQRRRGVGWQDGGGGGMV